MLVTPPTGEAAFLIPLIPAGCKALAAAGFGLGLGSLGTILVSEAVQRRKRGRQDPVWGEQPFNPGKSCENCCNPCNKEMKCWQATHKGNAQWHWIEWEQNPSTCMCYPKRREGPDKPAGCTEVR